MADDAPLIEARGLVKRFGDVHRRRRHRRRGAPRRGVRVPRPERRRQVVDDAHDRLHVAGQPRARCASSGSTRPRDGRRSGPASASCPRPTSSTPSCRSLENLVIYGRYFDIPRPSASAGRRELLEFVQLTERSGSRVDPLSGGMKRRVTIARSLISEPDLLLLDEPTTGLDPQARHVLWDRLYRLKQQGVTLVLTTHYMDEAEQLCDRLVVMDEGRIVAEGSPRSADRAALDREVLELRFAAGTNDAHAVGRRGHRRARRGAARSCADLRPRRREGAGHGPRPWRRRRRARWCAAAASRTSSCASPGGRWSTDGATLVRC